MSIQSVLPRGDEEWQIILQSERRPRQLILSVGTWEAEQVRNAVDRVRSARPQPFELMRNLLRASGAKVTRIWISDIRHGMFYARVEVQAPGREALTIDARPSDAITLALRMGIAIEVHRRVMDNAGVVNDSDLEVPPPPSPRRPRRIPIPEIIQRAFDEGDFGQL